jgi:transposase
MAKPIIDDALWERIAPFLPPKPRRSRFPGRKPLDNRKALTGILFVLKTGIAWEDLPQELGCGSGMSCWRRLREWQQTGLWPLLRQLLQAKLPEAHKIDWSRAEANDQDKRAVVDSGADSTTHSLLPDLEHAVDNLAAQQITATLL